MIVPVASAACSCHARMWSAHDPHGHGDQGCHAREHDQGDVLDVVGVREDERQQSQRGAGDEEVGQRARLDTHVEKLWELPHRPERLETLPATSRR